MPYALCITYTAYAWYVVYALSAVYLLCLYRIHNKSVYIYCM